MERRPEGLPRDQHCQATATLTDVTAIRGVPPTTIESVERVLVAGRRYLILAMEYPQRPGVLVAGGCAGYVRPAARANAFRAWLESLERPSSGGRILGSVVARGVGSDVSTWPSVAGARIVAHGPVMAETTSASDGQYALTGLPDGKYEVSITLPEGRHGLLAPTPLKATLAGAHTVWDGDFRVEVDGIVAGVVVDVDGRAVSGAPVFLHARPRSSDPANGRFSLRLFRGIRYRFSPFGPDDEAAVTVDYVADGTPVRLVVPED